MREGSGAGPPSVCLGLAMATGQPKTDPWRERDADRQTDSWMDRRTDGRRLKLIQTDIQTNKERERESCKP